MLNVSINKIVNFNSLLNNLSMSSLGNMSVGEMKRSMKNLGLVNDPRIGELQVLKDLKMNSHIALISRELDIDNLQMFEEELNLRSSSSHPHLLRVYSFEKEKNFTSISNTNRCTIAIEWFNRDLDMELRKREELKVKELLN